MFKRAVDFLQQLIGVKQSAQEGLGENGDGEERRVRVRYPSSAQINFQPVNGVDGPRLTARVRNISLGGVNLVIPRPLEPGELLSIEMPATNGRPSATVLACVVHAAPTGKGEWSVGCTFSNELSNDDLLPFGAKRQKPAEPDDSRTWVRFPCNVTAKCQETAAPRQEPWAGQVLNISASGIGLVARRNLEPGTLLNMELHRGSEPAGHNILACVVHVSSHPDGQRALGCNFIRELTDDELKSLL